MQFRKLTPEKRQFIDEHHHEMNNVQLAKHLQVSDRTVGKYLQFKGYTGAYEREHGKTVTAPAAIARKDGYKSKLAFAKAHGHQNVMEAIDAFGNPYRFRKAFFQFQKQTA